MRDDGDLAWIEMPVPITSFAFPNFHHAHTMNKWVDASEVKVKGIIGARASLPLHVIPEVVTDSFSNPMDAPAIVPWAPNPVNVGWKRFWTISTPIANFMDPWDELSGAEGLVMVKRWVFFPRHRVKQGVTIWANYNLRDIPVVNEPEQCWTDPQVSYLLLKICVEK